MNATAYLLPDGEQLLDYKLVEGRPYGMDSVTSRQVTYQGDDAGGQLVDRDGRTIREVKPSPGKSSRRREDSTSRPDRRRWVTLNTFVDRVARHLDAHEVAVWLVLFRWTQDDHAEIRLEDIAGRVGKSTRAVSRAVDRLLEVGLIERLKRGTRQGGPSRYRLEPDPAAALPKLTDGRESQPDAGDTLRPAPKHRKRDRRGAFTTGRG